MCPQNPQLDVSDAGGRIWRWCVRLTRVEPSGYAQGARDRLSRRGTTEAGFIPPMRAEPLR
jgi:hypothetical protein